MRPDIEHVRNYQAMQHIGPFPSKRDGVLWIVADHHLPSIISMVIDPFSTTRPPNQELAIAADEGMRQVGMDLIDTTEYRRIIEGMPLPVGRREGHRNAIADHIFTSMLVSWIGRLDRLQTYRSKSLGHQAPPSSSRFLSSAFAPLLSTISNKRLDAFPPIVLRAVDRCDTCTADIPFFLKKARSHGTSSGFVSLTTSEAPSLGSD